MKSDVQGDQLLRINSTVGTLETVLDLTLANHRNFHLDACICPRWPWPSLFPSPSAFLRRRLEFCGSCRFWDSCSVNLSQLEAWNVHVLLLTKLAVVHYLTLSK